ncbi:TPA: hypothetical protein ENS27_16145 [bacterium]|nr:hypothetical protein [bacterium]
MAKKKSQALSIPASLDEADRYIASIAELQRKINLVQLQLNTQLAELTKKAKEECKPLEQKINTLVKGLYIFADTHREKITDGFSRQTVEVSSGVFGWRQRPETTEVEDEDQAIKELEELGLKECIRVKKTVNKEAIEALPKDVVEKLKFITVKEGDEVFSVKPKEVKISFVKGKRSIKREDV